MRWWMLFALLFTSTFAQAEPRGLVAVLPLAESGGIKLTQAQRDLLQEAIHTHTSEALSARGYTVLTGENTLRVLRENGVDPTQVCETNCALDAAKELKASYFLSGSINYVEGSYVVTLRMSESNAGRVLSSVRLRAEKIIAITDDFTVKSSDFFAKALAGTEEGDVNVTAVARPKATEPIQKTTSRELPSTIDVIVRSSLGEQLDGAQIFVDGRLEGTAPRSIQISPGDHTIRVDKELHFSKSANVSLRPADTQRLDFELKPDFGQFDITSRPVGATVTVDGIRVGETPLKQVRLKSGNRLVVVEKDENLPVSRQLLVKAGQLAAIDVSLEGDVGPLTVISTPIGADVFLDNALVGTTPLKLPRVRAGKHLVMVKADPNGYEPWKQEINVVREAGATLNHVTLTRRETDVIIRTQPPGAKVELDDTTMGETTLKLHLLGGDYQMRIRKHGYAPLTKTIQVRPPEPLVLDLKLRTGGTGVGGRYTYADLGLRPRPIPPEPVLLPESRVELRNVWTLEQVVSGVKYGALAGTLAGTLVVVLVEKAKTDKSSADALSTSTSPNEKRRYGLISGGSLLGGFIGILISHAVAEPDKVTVDDPDAVRANAEAQRRWKVQAADAQRHNKEIDRQLKEANAELGVQE